jgi:hypothetical protein
MIDDSLWPVLRENKQAKFDADRAKFLNDAVQSDDGGWTKHTEYHWSRIAQGKRLDYWPSRKKFQIDGKVFRGLRLLNKTLKGTS